MHWMLPVSINLKNLIVIGNEILSSQYVDDDDSSSYISTKLVYASTIARETQ